MPRADFRFHRSGECYSSRFTSLEEDRRWEEEEDGCPPEDLSVHHLTLESTEERLSAMIDLLCAAHTVGGDDETENPVNHLVSMIFMAGVEYGRKHVLSPLLERTAQKGL